MTSFSLKPARLAVPVVVALALTAAAGGSAAQRSQARLAVVGYKSPRALQAAVRASGGRIVRKLPALHVAEIAAPPSALGLMRELRGVRFATRPVERESLAEPALAPASVVGGAYE